MRGNYTKVEPITEKEKLAYDWLKLRNDSDYTEEQIEEFKDIIRSIREQNRKNAAEWLKLNKDMLYFDLRITAAKTLEIVVYDFIQCVQYKEEFKVMEKAFTFLVNVFGVNYDTHQRGLTSKGNKIK